MNLFEFLAIWVGFDSNQDPDEDSSVDEVVVKECEGGVADISDDQEDIAPCLDVALINLSSSFKKDGNVEDGSCCEPSTVDTEAKSHGDPLIDVESTVRYGVNGHWKSGSNHHKNQESGDKETVFSVEE